MSLLQYSPGLSANTTLQNQANSLYNLQANAPQIQNTLNAQTQDSANTQYNQQKQNIDTSYNQRGLLYSGLKTGAEGAAANSAAQGAAQGTMQNNQNVANMLNTAGNQAVSSNLGAYQGWVGASQNNFQNQMQAYQQQQQAAGSLGSGLGMLAGLGIAGLTGGAALPFMMGGSAAGGVFSDKRLKKDVKDADDDDLKEYLDKAEPKSFSYKDESHGEGKYIGLMAQDMEKSGPGKLMIIESPEGKKIDPVKALMTVMAVQSHLNKRLKNVEKYADGGEVQPQQDTQQKVANLDPAKLQQAQSSLREAFHFKLGGSVPGEGRGDHIVGLLTPHEIVLPTKVTMAKNAPEKAKEFVKKEKAS